MLKTVDLSKSLAPEVYKTELLKWQLKLREQAYQLYQRQRSLVRRTYETIHLRQIVQHGYSLAPVRQSTGPVADAESRR